MTKTESDFRRWKAQVNAIIEDRVGLQSDDLTDCPYQDWFEQGVSPKAAASKAIRSANE